MFWTFHSSAHSCYCLTTEGATLNRFISKIPEGVQSGFVDAAPQNVSSGPVACLSPSSRIRFLNAQPLTPECEGKTDPGSSVFHVKNFCKYQWSPVKAHGGQHRRRGCTEITLGLSWQELVKKKKKRINSEKWTFHHHLDFCSRKLLGKGDQRKSCHLVSRHKSTETTSSIFLTKRVYNRVKNDMSLIDTHFLRSRIPRSCDILPEPASSVESPDLE